MICTTVGAHCNTPPEIRGARQKPVPHPRIARFPWLSLLMLSTQVAIAAPPGGSLEIVKPWSRATAPGTTVGVAYLEIVNSGKQDTLVRVEATVARRVEMHSMATVGGVMQMRELLSVDVPAQGRVRFEPSGLHMMLIDLAHPLKKGDRIPLILVFQHAGKVPAEAIVQDLGTMTPPGGKDAE
jgi:periplasmic copper chaperone A